MTFEQVMQLTRTIGDPSALQDEEARLLYDLCMEVPPTGTVAEIGCDIGRTSSVIAQVAKERGYWSIHVDPWRDEPHRSNFIRWMQMMDSIGGKFEVHRMPSAEARYFDRLALLLIDGNHYEEGITIDCRIASEYVRPLGRLAIHDYGQPVTPDVKKVVDRMIVPPMWEQVTVVKTLGVWKKR